MIATSTRTVTAPTAVTDISTEISAGTRTAASTASRRPLWRAALASGVVAAAAASLVAIAARGVGIDLAIDGEEIPVAGFAQLTMIGALLGLALAKVCSSWARSPRAAFVRTTVLLTALSIVPDVLVDASTGSKLTLALTHVVAAAIVVPSLATRLPR